MSRRPPRRQRKTFRPLTGPQLESLVALVAENVRRYSTGLALLNVVDKQRGY